MIKPQRSIDEALTEAPAKVSQEPIALPSRRERLERREDALIAAARAMIKERGYHKTTITGIAKRAGVADGTVYLYFQNKEAIARAVLADFYAELTRSAQSGVDALSTPHERLRFLAQHNLSRMLENRRLLEVLPLIDLSLDRYEGSALYEMNRDYAAVFSRVVKDGMALGQIRNDIEIWQLRDMFFGAMEFGSRTILMKNKPEDQSRFVDSLMSLLFAKASAWAGGPEPTLNDAAIARAAARLEAAAARIERAVKA